MKEMKNVMEFVSTLGLLIIAHEGWAIPNLKLPFPNGETWSITTGYGGSAYHSGHDYYAIDFNLPGDSDLNKQILAVASGNVIFADWKDEYGWTVDIDHGSGYTSRYAHLNEKPVVSGSVNQGQEIGKCGMSGGTSTGPHLHFVLYYNGQSVKPEPMSGYTNFLEGGSYTSDNYFNPASLVALRSDFNSPSSDDWTTGYDTQ
ncbi:hypothetical protein COU01_03555, partial [Candidatus Falkowbacteria bacterium CG10_big_fil_rev_8_21_14_0_10_44_15]